MLNIFFPILLTIFPFSHGTNAVSCTITVYNEVDILNAQKECSEITFNGLSVPAGKTLKLTRLKPGSRVMFSGTMTWGYKEWKGPLLLFSGADLEITGSFDHILDGRGQLWWDGLGGGGGKRKPKFFTAQNLYNTRIANMNITNSPVHVFSIKECDGLVFENIKIDDKDGDTLGGHNTDGFDIGNDSNNVTIRHCTIYNQDDCLAIKSGSNYVFTDNYCYGGHGISIGSVGNVTVDSVYMANCQVENSAYGIRIKTVYGEHGSVCNVTFKNITLKDINEYGIAIEGDYLNGGPTGIATDGVPITNLTIRDIKGTVQNYGTNIYVLVKGAKNWYCSDIDITGGEIIKECEGIPPESGLSCLKFTYYDSIMCKLFHKQSKHG